MKGLIQLISWSALAICAIVWLFANSNYNRDVDNYLKKAAGAQSVWEVQAHLDTALANIKERGLTEGSTEIISSQLVSDSNITVWYRDISMAAEMARLLSEPIRGREKSVTVRENDSLLAMMDIFFQAARINEHGAYAPTFISIYPNQGLIVILGCIALIILLVTGGIKIFSRS